MSFIWRTTWRLVFFTYSRLATLELIASQAAISLEPARLYDQLSQENSDRKKAEEALRASEERLQDIIDSTTAVIFVKDLELRFLLVNREFERRHRVRRDEIRGQSDFDIHSREVAEAVRANDLRVIEAGKPSQFEELVPTADGKRVCLAVKFLLRDRSGKPYAVCGIATDINRVETRGGNAGGHGARTGDAGATTRGRLGLDNGSASIN